MKVMLNPDAEMVKLVREGLERSGGYCPCRMIAPFVAEIAEEQAGKVKVGKVNVDEEPELAGTFRVNSIPTLILFKGGQPVNVAVGAMPKAQIEALLK